MNGILIMTSSAHALSVGSEGDGFKIVLHGMK